MDRDPLREVYPDMPPRTHYAALDQLAPGDRIWLDGAWRTVVTTAIEDDMLHVFTGAGEHTIDFHDPAALLIRRAET